MNASKDNDDEKAALITDAAVRACTFDFAGAEDLCGKVLALEEHEGGSKRYTPRAHALLKAMAHNKCSYLYNLTVKDSRHAPSGSERVRGRRLFEKAKAALRSAEQTSEARVAGSYDVRFDQTHMVVSGSASGAFPVLHAFINELLIASVATVSDANGDPQSNHFSFRISTRSLSLLPGHEKARLAISTGSKMLHHTTGGAFFRFDWPDGKGGIEDAVMNGAMLTSHEHIKAPPAPATVARWLYAYERIATFMNDEWGMPVFLYYGSLLGAIRERQVIPFDDDFDVAYFSSKRSSPEIKEEMISIVARLAALNPDLVIRLNTFFFKILVRGCVIDVFPTWHDGNVLWSPWATCLDCDEGLLRDVVETEFHGRRVLVPAQAERFLELRYGAGWRTPDPTYRVRSRDGIDYPFRTIPFDAEDRSRIVEKAREIAGDAAVATVKLMKE